MKLYRLYSDDDGQSHFAPLDRSEAAQVFETVHGAKGFQLKQISPPHIQNWHRAPRRQWVITLSGSVDIGLGNGTKMSFEAGDVFLAEDTTGQGHTATPHDWVRAYVHAI
jgi:hypothetical protein